MNYYLDAWYVLKEKLWWINKQLSKSSIGCFTLQGILSLAFDTISAAGKDFQSSECWSIARRSKTPCRARQTKKSLWTCRIKSHLPLSATPAWAGKLCPHFFGPSMINKWSLEHLYSCHAIKILLKNVIEGNEFQKELPVNNEAVPHEYSKWFLTKVQKQFSEGKIVFTTNDANVSGHPQGKKWMNFNPSLIFYTESNSKWITGLNVKL